MAAIRARRKGKAWSSKRTSPKKCVLAIKRSAGRHSFRVEFKRGERWKSSYRVELLDTKLIVLRPPKNFSVTDEYIEKDREYIFGGIRNKVKFNRTIVKTLPDSVFLPPPPPRVFGVLDNLWDALYDKVNLGFTKNWNLSKSAEIENLSW